MPPRLLPKSYGFIDTVHRGAVSSVWTTNRFCNQYAAMPSLHFGYSLIVGWSLFANAPAGTRTRPRARARAGAAWACTTSSWATPR